MRQGLAQSSLAYEQVGGWGVKEIVAELRAAWSSPCGSFRRARR